MKRHFTLEMCSFQAEIAASYIMQNSYQIIARFVIFIRFNLLTKKKNTISSIYMMS